MGERHLTPGTAEWHAFNVGMLVTQLELLEFYARRRIATAKQSPVNYLWTIQAGDSVPEDAVTDYDQLRVVLKRFVQVAGRQLDVDALVELRDQLAHGRIIPHSPTEEFPLTLLKFGRPRNAKVPVLQRVQMDEVWFKRQRSLVDQSIDIVGVV